MPAMVDVTTTTKLFLPGALEFVTNVIAGIQFSGYGQPMALYRVTAIPKPGVDVPYERFSYDILLGNNPTEAAQHLLDSVDAYNLFGHQLIFGYKRDTILMDMQRETRRRLSCFPTA